MITHACQKCKKKSYLDLKLGHEVEEQTRLCSGTLFNARQQLAMCESRSIDHVLAEAHGEWLVQREFRVMHTAASLSHALQTNVVFHGGTARTVKTSAWHVSNEESAPERHWMQCHIPVPNVCSTKSTSARVCVQLLDLDGLKHESSHVIGADPLLRTVFVHYFNQLRQFAAFVHERLQIRAVVSAAQDPLSARIQSKKGHCLDAAQRVQHVTPVTQNTAPPLTDISQVCRTCASPANFAAMCAQCSARHGATMLWQHDRAEWVFDSNCLRVTTRDLLRAVESLQYRTEIVSFQQLLPRAFHERAADPVIWWLSRP